MPHCNFVTRQPIVLKRLAASFEDLNSSLAQSASDLWSCKVMINKWLTQVLNVKPTWQVLRKNHILLNYTAFFQIIPQLHATTSSNIIHKHPDYNE